MRRNEDRFFRNPMILILIALIFCLVACGCALFDAADEKQDDGESAPETGQFANNDPDDSANSGEGCNEVDQCLDVIDECVTNATKTYQLQNCFEDFTYCLPYYDSWLVDEISNFIICFGTLVGFFWPECWEGDWMDEGFVCEADPGCLGTCWAELWDCSYFECENDDFKCKQGCSFQVVDNCLPNCVGF